jgi:DNA primase
MHLKRPVPLFNTDTLKDLKAGDKVYICEGVFDAMMLEQQGYKAVAILGVNNFKPEMAELFKGLEVVLCLDNDESGKLGTQTLARVFLFNGQSGKTKTLPDGVKDITEYFIK